MDYTQHQQGNECALALTGNFTFSDNAKFRNIICSLRETPVDNVNIDINQLEFIDSAALGMLLLLYDEARKKGMTVSLNGARGQIKKILQLSNFEQIFTITYA